MASPDQNKANVKAFYDLAFNQRQPEEAVKQYVGSSYRQHNAMAGDGPVELIRFRGHLPKGGYDVPTDGRHTEAAPPPSPVHR